MTKIHGITFETAEYVRSHGREPRGRGLWFFEIVYADGSTKDETFSGTLTSARSYCANTLRNRGEAERISYVNVMP